MLSVVADWNLGSGSLTLAGGTLQTTGGTAFSSAKAIGLTANSDVNAADSAGTTLSGAISGGSMLTKTGNGTLVLTGNNSYSGGTTIAAGLLQLGSTSALGSATGPLSVAGGLLDLHGYSLSVGALNGGGTIDSLSGGGALTAGCGNASGTFSGVIQNTVGSLSMTKTGSGLLVLSGSNTYSGPTTINGGTLQVGNGGSGESIGNTAYASLSNNATLAFNQADSTVFSPNVGGAGNLAKAGTGVLTMAGSLSYSGSTQVSGGTLVLLADDASTSSYTANAGGALQFNGTTVNLGIRSVRANSGGSVQYVNSTIDSGFLYGPGTHSLPAGASSSTQRHDDQSHRRGAAGWKRHVQQRHQPGHVEQQRLPDHQRRRQRRWR